MPLVNVYIGKGKTKEEKRDLMDFIGTSLNKAVGASVSSVYVFIKEMDAENITIDAPVVEISWITSPQRSPEAKKQIAEELIEKLETFSGAEANKIVVTFTEMNAENVITRKNV